MGSWEKPSQSAWCHQKTKPGAASLIMTPTIPTLMLFLSFPTLKWPKITTECSVIHLCFFSVLGHSLIRTMVKRKQCTKERMGLGFFCPLYPPRSDSNLCVNKEKHTASKHISVWGKEGTLSPARLWYLRGRRAIKLVNKRGWRVQGDCLKCCVDANAEFLERRLKTVIQAERSKVSAGFFICVLCCCFKPRTRFVLRSKSSTRGLWGD